MFNFKKDGAISSSVIAAMLFLIGCVVAVLYYWGQQGMFRILNDGMIEQTINYASTLQ